MPHQTSSKKSAVSAKALLPKQKRAKRPRVDVQPDDNTTNLPSAKLSRTVKTEKTRPSVSFAPPASDSPRKGVPSAAPTELARDKVKKRTPSAIKSSPASTSASLGSRALPRAFTIIVGSYEKLLYGIEGTYASDLKIKDGTSSYITPTLKPVFIFPGHVASVRAVAASPDGGKWLATGSSDEIIKVWDLKRKKEVGGLMQHEGSITHLSFVSRTHLISASEDGTIALFHTRDWAVLTVLKGHKGRINSVAVHPTGKVALSVGKDRALRMWDLMRGKPSASTLLRKEGELVRWSVDGGQFVVQSENMIDIYRTDMTIIQTISHPSRVQDVRFARHPLIKQHKDMRDLLFVAAEDKRVSVYASSPKVGQPDKGETANDKKRDESGEPAQEFEYKIVAELVGHTNRVKSIDLLQIALPSADSGSEESSTTILASASSDGKIHVYDLASLPQPPLLTDLPVSPPKSTLDPIAVYDTKGTRLTCLTLAGSESWGQSSSKIAGVKRRRAHEIDEEEDGEEEDR